MDVVLLLGLRREIFIGSCVLDSSDIFRGESRFRGLLFVYPFEWSLSTSDLDFFFELGSWLSSLDSNIVVIGG